VISKKNNYSQHAVSVMSADVHKLGYINTLELRNGGYERAPQTATTHTANRYMQAIKQPFSFKKHH